MASPKIPKEVTAAIKKCWPHGVVEQFDEDESYFHEIRDDLERDLRKVRGASLMWQTEERESSAMWDEDWKDEPPPPAADWQSFHCFFLAPKGKEFHFEDETESLVEPEDPGEEEWTETTFPGEGWFGCAVGICLAAPVAVISLGQYSRYEDGSFSEPDVESYIISDDTGEKVDNDEYYRGVLSADAFQTLQQLRSDIAGVLLKHGLMVLDPSILDLPAPRLKAGEEVFLDEPVRVRDAFFFHGI